MLTPATQLFFGAHAATLDALDADAAIFGAPHGTPYPGMDNRAHEGTAEALRAVWAGEDDWTDHWDFDYGGTIHQGGFRIADLGDLATMPEDGPGNRTMIEQTTRAILAKGAVPFMIGGDDSVPIPFLSAFDQDEPVTILQIDAHIDWREERRGEPLGFSSTMRRASEMAHVERIVQVGIRNFGSARRAEVEDAEAWGARIVTAREIIAEGPEAALRHIPEGARVVVTLDVDAIDLSQMPAVISPTPGGLTYTHVTGLIAGITAKARLAGLDLIEFVPARDPSGTAAIVASNIVKSALGHLAMQGTTPA